VIVIYIFKFIFHRATAVETLPFSGDESLHFSNKFGFTNFYWET